ncbi:hypothetical protein HGH93_12580 [Chitinophaga polysaccharea]|uniref:hypothetical protein n=1 Tax=Chitinophaga TaxID=79328 RepID=UPI0014555985|nr:MULTISPECIES: hypothetical protein [Chitinophaga]NLR58942.1 hypothetical protein [Chitinophaga polysaccharea]NLU92272.1 hypothetical protein [Chitinophaga sp. Ak27]
MKFRIFTVILFLLSTSAAFAQLKVGSNPSQINKSSILELESTRQGLLLPRIPGANLTAAPLNAAPDGMIIYVTDSSSLFIRKNGLWQKMSVDSVANNGNWNTIGNAGLDSNKNFIGTTDQQALVFKTGNAERMRLSANGNIKVAAGTIPTGTNQLQVMVIDPATGTLLQRTMAASAFNNAIVSLNGLRDTVQTFAVDSTAAKDFSITSTNGVHTFNIPSQSGTGATSRGLLSYNDWLRFDSSARFQILHTLFSTAPDPNGISVNNGTLTLHAADATNPGAVSAGDQTFGGNKTFQNNVHVVQNATIDGNVVLTNINNAAPTDSSNVLIRRTDGTVVKRLLNDNAFKTLVIGKSPGTANDINIDSSSATQTVINVPDASTTVRGVINLLSGQTFAGYKSFRDSLAVGVAEGTKANSSFQVVGSVATNLTKVTSSYAATAGDNTILADATGGALTITLPSPSTIAGRIYTIKKVGSGGIDKEVTIATSGGTIDGSSNYIIYNDWTFVTIQTDGTDWYVIKK